MKYLFLYFASIIACMAQSAPSLTEQQIRSVDLLFSDWDKADVPGASIGIFKDGHLLYARGYGLANLEYDIPNSSKSVFRIASTSKQFTAASIIILAEKGLLNLDDKLNQFFPHFPDYAKSITIKHLLNHTSGIRDYLSLSSLKGLGDNDYYSDKDVMSLLEKQKELNFEPGSEHLYSNSGYWLLGQIVNQVAKMNMADFAEKEIFKPLGMKNTHFHNDHKKIVKNRSTGYLPNQKNGYQISVTTLDMIGDGGIFTTIEDIKKWDDAYYQSKVLGTSFWDKMTEQGLLNSGEKISYASGLDIGTYKGLKTISHGGAFVGYRAELIRFPEQRFSIAIFTNRGDANPSQLSLKVADVFLKNLYKPESTTEQLNSPPQVEETAKLSLKSIPGSYQLRPGFEFNVELKGAVLHVVQHWNKSEFDLKPTEHNTFEIADDSGIEFSFSKLENNLAQRVTVNQSGRISSWNRKKDVDWSKLNLKDYVGQYYSQELDSTYTLSNIDGQLNTSINGAEAFPLLASDIDVFSYRSTVTRFTRSENNVSGFVLDAGRVKNLEFVLKK